MFKMTRLALLAAVALLGVSGAAIPQAAQAQPQPPATAAAPAEPAAATAAPAPKAASSAKATEVVDNPYGLEALWKGGDIVAKITLAILAIMSMGSWYIIITKVYEQYKMGRHARAADKTFWTAPSVKQGADAVQQAERQLHEAGIFDIQRPDVGMAGQLVMLLQGGRQLFPLRAEGLLHEGLRVHGGLLG